VEAGVEISVSGQRRNNQERQKLQTLFRIKKGEYQEVGLEEAVMLQ
jgi:hypothetical protein